MSTETARRAIEAYGGEASWRSASAVEASFSAGGWAFRLKLQRPARSLRVRVELARPSARVWPIDRAGRAAVLDGRQVRIEEDSGQVLESRADPRRLFPYGRRLLWWDRLDQAYFSGYALWNYLALPALLLREDITWSEPAPSTLEARFPPELPTHCAVQRFHFDPATGLLRQHDYTAEVFGGWARAAHVVLEHTVWDGVPVPSRRRVTPRRADGRPRSGPVLVHIEIHGWKLL
jgi:hypothetical protein